MRSKQEILSDASQFAKSVSITDVGRFASILTLGIEVLLDIRDALDSRPAVTFPESPKPPEV